MSIESKLWLTQEKANCIRKCKTILLIIFDKLQGLLKASTAAPGERRRTQWGLTFVTSVRIGGFSENIEVNPWALTLSFTMDQVYLYWVKRRPLWAIDLYTNDPPWFHSAGLDSTNTQHHYESRGVEACETCCDSWGISDTVYLWPSTCLLLKAIW